MNSTILAFDYPNTLIHEASSWVVLLRPVQVTLGSMVLACKEEAQAFHDLSPAALSEMPLLMSTCERVLKSLFQYDKINHLLLMMVDPHVHYHVLPRYAYAQPGPLPQLQGLLFEDAGWPAMPRLDLPTKTNAEQNGALVALLKDGWAHIA